MATARKAPAGKKAAAKKPPAKKAAAKSAPRKAAAKKPEAKRPVGRPTAYREEYADLAYKFCLLGANNSKLAQLFGVADATVDNWIREIPEFLGAVKSGREEADANIAKSLYRRALGYSHPEDDIRALNGEIVITPTIKHYPPDTGAATLWLKNRQPHLWRDKVETVHQNPDGSPLDFSLKVSFVTPGGKKDGD